METDTESLRSSAPQWSLAGDKQLLGVLQNIHETLVSRCQETNRHLSEMAAALDDASIDLQNVNNKFMALSNSQFIESRVYDDDLDVAAPAESNKEPPKTTESMTEIDQIKMGLKVLEDMHEPLVILDSDIDSDSDEEIARTILKPKNMYEDRPLPYIIGSYAWQSKWHAGLLPEDSDTDSSVKREPWDREEYSESETEISKPAKDEESIASCDISEYLTPHAVVPQEPKSQASVANELAKRLRGELPEAELPKEEISPPATTVKKIYRPEPPATSNIFLDEPPPLDHTYQSDDEENDIFAELRKNQPYHNSSTVQSDVTDELFGAKRNGDVFGDFREPAPPINQISTVLSEESEPDLFAPPVAKTVVPVESNVKKPIGGISLFGNKGTESIGAAILKRNRKQSSSDEDLNENPSPKPEKDIFDHLFAKSEKEYRKVEKNIEKEAVKEEKVNKKVDLFSDNLFDDIDDIFTSNIPKVPIKPADKNQKSLFDDDDDLFSGVSAVKNTNDSVKDAKMVQKSIFDSDDDLFSDKDEKIKPKDESKDTSEIKKEISVKSDSKKSIFDSDEDLFTDNTEKLIENKHIDNSKNSKVVSKARGIFDDSDSDIISENAENKPKHLASNKLVEENANAIKTGTKNTEVLPVPILEAKKSSLFDDDEDLFKTENNTKDIMKKTEIQNADVTTEQKTKSIFDDESETQSIEDKKIDLLPKHNKIGDKFKSSLFDDDSEDELFTEKPKPTSSKKNESIKSLETSQSLLKNDDDLFKETDVTNTSNFSAIEQTLKAEIKEIKSERTDEVNNELKKDNNDPDGRTKESNVVTSIDLKSSKFDEEDNLDSSIFAEKNVANGKSTISKDLDDELFTNPSINTQIKDRAEDYFKTPKLEEINSDINTTEIYQTNDKHKEKPSLFNETKQYSDIFIEPPEFEKPKEPKKSKNVNALFDDDSDDEALFFKKNDATLDEKPEFESPSTENRLFGIFHDEPPDLDVDFIQKSNVNITNISDESVSILKSDIADSTKDQTDSILITKHTDITVQDDIFKSLETSIEDNSKHETLFGTKDPDSTDNAPKPIGKLKSMNFNINVNALLPGASPKKVRATEQTDENIQTKSSEDISVKNTHEIETKMVKSISFEGKPDSKVLDNTLSKERAKIQVKRRPSTRRARKEAVRKSAIDFGDDSTDNSSSIDDQPKDTKKEITQSQDDLHRPKDVNNKSESENVLEGTKNNNNRTSIEDIKQNNDISKNINTVDADEDIFNVESEVTSKENPFFTEIQQKTDNITTRDNDQQKPEVTTKTVYILNDEDIFSVEKPKKVLNIVDDDIPNISTLGKVYKEAEKLDSDSEDELFKNANTKSKKASSDKLFKQEVNTKTDDKNLFQPKTKVKVTKSDDIKIAVDENFTKASDKNETKSIFDLSDDDDELFFKNKSKDGSNEVFMKETKKVEVKSSLFDDEDDDLFGGSKKTVEPSSSQPRGKDIVTKSYEPVFEDPLSLFGGDDD